MPMKKKLLIGLIPLMGWAFLPAAHAENVENSQYNIVLPVKNSFSGNSVTIGGTVSPKNSATLAAQMPGRVLQLAGKEGDRFKAQDVLVVMNTEALLAKRQAAVSQLNSANMAWHNAKIQHHRQIVSPNTSQNAPGGMGMPNMFDQVITNPMANMMGTRDSGAERSADVFNRRTQVDQAAQQVMQAQAAIQQIDAKLRDTRTLAPFDGVIVKKLVEIGDTVQPGQPMLEFADTQALQVIVDIPSRLVEGMQVNDVIRAKLDSDEGDVNAKVATIFPVADSARHTIRVELDLPPQVRAAAGTYAEVYLNDAQATVSNFPTIPNSAIIWRGGLPMVYVLDDKQQTSLRIIRIGETLPNGEMTILSGLKENEMIVDKPSPSLTSGHTLNQP